MRKTLLVTLLFVWQVNENIFAEKVYGGFDVSIERVPHHVQIIFDKMCQCGGSILRREVILTAAHCTFKDDNLTIPLIPKEIQVIAGSDRRLEGTRIGVNAYSVHPYFKNTTLHTVYNDVALIILEKSLEYSNRIQPIQIVNSMTQPLPEGTNLFVVGFGYYKLWTQPDHLKGIFLPKTNDRKCEEYLNIIGAKKYESQICLGNLTIAGKDTCGGDSGGSVTYEEMLYATVSYGVKACGPLGMPSVYANLITLNGWIRQAAKDMGFPIP